MMMFLVTGLSKLGREREQQNSKLREYLTCEEEEGWKNEQMGGGGKKERG